MAVSNAKPSIEWKTRPNACHSWSSELKQYIISAADGEPALGDERLVPARFHAAHRPEFSRRLRNKHIPNGD